MHARFLHLVVAFSLLGEVSGCEAGILWGCKRPEVTAFSLNSCDVDKDGRPRETGIPFYLPKPLLIIAKNFRNIEEAKVGLTDTAPIPTGFDDQSKYADLNARTNFNGLNGAAVSGAAAQPDAADANVNTGTSMKSAPVLHSGGAPVIPVQVPSDGLAPATFYTYHIIFVPDLTQKYGLKIRGGPGEIRAAMNLVNGWQFTGIGPFYMKDSSTAQNVLADGIAARLGGQAAADILNASADLAKVLGRKQGATVGAEEPNLLALSKTLGELRSGLVPMTLPNFAEIHVYEARLTPEGLMVWSEITNFSFNRDYLGMERLDKVYAPKTAQAPLAPTGPLPGQAQGAAVGGGIPESVARMAVAGVFGVSPDSRAITPAPGGLQGAATGPVPAGGVNQIQVDCGSKNGCKPCKEFNFFCKKEPPRRTIQNRTLIGGAALAAEAANPGIPGILPTGPGTKGIAPGGSAQGAAIPGATPAIINQPIFNNPGSNPASPSSLPKIP